MSTLILTIQPFLFRRDVYRSKASQFLCIVHDSCTCHVTYWGKLEAFVEYHLFK